MILFGHFSYCSIAKHLESGNTMFSFIWWIIGFYWVSAGGQTLTREAPQLYWYSSKTVYLRMWLRPFFFKMFLIWIIFVHYLFYRLSIVFLAFDVFFVVFCVALACVIGIAVCCCLPCIIAILYAVADQVFHFHFLVYLEDEFYQRNYYNLIILFLGIVFFSPPLFEFYVLSMSMLLV